MVIIQQITDIHIRQCRAAAFNFIKAFKINIGLVADLFAGNIALCPDEQKINSQCPPDSGLQIFRGNLQSYFFKHFSSCFVIIKTKPPLG